MTVGERIRELRRKNGMSQEALAERLNMSRQAVSKWEQNVCEPNLECLTAMSELFGVELDFLIAGKQKPATRAEKEGEESGRGAPAFWTIGKENVFVLLVSLAALIVYAVQIRRAGYSMTVFVCAEIFVFAVGTIVTVASDKKARTGKGFLALILPVAVSIIAQAIVGVCAEC